MWEYNYTDELYHHGIKGMKWGVRRFESKGGSYTRRGIKKINKSFEDYDSAKQRRDSSKKSGDKHGARLAKADMRAAKRQAKSDYKNLKKDYKADQGKTLYADGKTITGNLIKNTRAQSAIVAGSLLLNTALRATGNRKVANMVSNTVAIGGTAVNAFMAGKTMRENSRLRAYYGHGS